MPCARQPGMVTMGQDGTWSSLDQDPTKQMVAVLLVRLQTGDHVWSSRLARTVNGNCHKRSIPYPKELGQEIFQIWNFSDFFKLFSQV